MSGKQTRRVFLGQTAPAVIGAGLIGARTRAAERTSALGANDTINVGVIGCGARGKYLSYISQITPGMRVVALCDVNEKHLAEVHKDAGEKPAIFRDFRKLLEHKPLDVVVVATNGHWHALPAIMACAAGKDVYLEKPIGASVGEGRFVADAARRHNRIVQMGTQQRSWEHYHQAVEIIRSGELGVISTVQVFDLENFEPFGSPADEAPPAHLDWDLWLGPAPKVPYNRNRYTHHYWFHDYSGSWQSDWGVHHYDIVHWAMGVDAPEYVSGTGGRFAFTRDESNVEWPDTFNGVAQYGPGPVARQGFQLLYTLRSRCNQRIEGRIHGKVFYGSNGVLALDRSGFDVFPQVKGEKKLIAEKTVRSAKSEHEVVQDHMKKFAECVRDRKTPFASADVGNRSSAPGHLMNIAYRVGRSIRWDAKREQVHGAEEANKLVAKEYRAPWSLTL